MTRPQPMSGEPVDRVLLMFDGGIKAYRGGTDARTARHVPELNTRQSDPVGIQRLLLRAHAGTSWRRVNPVGARMPPEVDATDDDLRRWGLAEIADARARRARAEARAKAKAGAEVEAASGA